MKNYDYRILTILLYLCLLDFFSIWLIMFFYLTNIDLLFLVNLNFLMMFLLLIGHLLYSRKLSANCALILFVLLFISILKLFLLPEESDPSYKTYFNYFYGIMMPIVSINYAINFIKEDDTRIAYCFDRFAKRALKFSSFGIVVYFLLYCLGYIHYFGLSVNLHYIYPFFLKSNPFTNTLFFMILIVLTGKRAILINFLFQVSGYFSSKFRKKPFLMMILFLLFLVVLIFVYQYTSLFDRYKVYFELDFQDVYLLRVAFSGRFEEVVGVYNYFMQHPTQLFFGAPPGGTYVWDLVDYIEYKNYAHLTLISYIFRYGLIAALMLYAFFIYVLKKYWSLSNPLSLIFLGVVIGSFFGSNLSVDVYPWLILGFLIRLKPVAS